MCKDDALAHLQKHKQNSHSQQGGWEILPPRSISICHCDTAENTGKRLMAEGETSAESHGSQRKHGLEKWSKGSEETLRRQKAAERKRLR